MKKQYEKPAMKVYELQQNRSMILCGSPGYNDEQGGDYQF